MTRTRLSLISVLILLLSACSQPRPSMSWVDQDVTAHDASILAADVVTHLSNYLPPARTTLILDHPAPDPNNILTETIVGSLRGSGYGVTVVDQKSGDQKSSKRPNKGTPLHYLVSQLDSGILLRLQYLETEATKFYPRTREGELSSDAVPFTLRGAQQ